MMSGKKVILADDDKILHEGLSGLLESSGYCVVASASSFDSLKELLRSQVVDYIVCDCKMPGDGPVNLLLFCKRFYPTCSVVFLTGLSSGFLFKHLLDFGADGLVSKRDSIHSLIACLTSIEDNRPYCSPFVVKYLEDSITQLTAKEFQVFELIVTGHSNNSIAEIFSNSPSTIGRHRENLAKKLKANSIVDMMRIAQESGLFDT